MGVKDFKLVWWYLQMNISSALEYRVNFITGMLGMMLNNAVWLFFWFIILSKFDSIRGWDFENVLQLYAIITIAWGITGVLFGNRGHMSHVIEHGALDFYLPMPADPLVHMLVSRLPISAFGEIAFGLVVALFSVPLSQVGLFALLCFLASVIVLGFCILVGSLSFFIGSSKTLERNLVMGLITFSTYPFSIFGGFAKFILLTFIPAGFVTGIPVGLLHDFSFMGLLGILVAGCVFLTSSVLLFRYGLRRYESGNLVVARI